MAKIGPSSSMTWACKKKKFSCSRMCQNHWRWLVLFDGKNVSLKSRYYTA